MYVFLLCLLLVIINNYLLNYKWQQTNKQILYYNEFNIPHTINRNNTDNNNNYINNS